MHSPSPLIDSKSRLHLPVVVGLLLLGLLSGTLLAGYFFSQQNQRLLKEVRAASARRIADASLLAPQAPIVVADANQLSDVFRTTAESVREAVVFVEVIVGPSTGAGFLHDRLMRQSVGSGVLISQEGYIVTNFHVVENASRIDVTLADKREFEAALVGFDTSTDLAVLRVLGEDLPFVRFGNSDGVEVGEWVLAIGNPFRLTSTVTAGIVSALSRDVNIIENESSSPIEDFIQTDAAINPGNSGGALVDLAGSLIGVNTAIATESGNSEGYGFAVPANLVRRVVADIIEYGEVRRGYLGVSIQPTTNRDAERAGLSGVHGVLINDVCSGCSAERSGLLPGDIVLSVNDRDVNAPNQLQSIVASNRPGDELRLVVWRNRQAIDIRVVLRGRDDPTTDGWLAELTEPPSPEPQQPEADFFHRGGDVEAIQPWGFGVRPLSGRDRRDFGVSQGLYVAFVESETPASVGGLQRGVVLESIDGITVESVDQLRSVLSESTTEPVVFRVISRDRVPLFFELDPELPQ